MKKDKEEKKCSYEGCNAIINPHGKYCLEHRLEKRREQKHAYNKKIKNDKS